MTLATETDRMLEDVAEQPARPPARTLTDEEVDAVVALLRPHRELLNETARKRQDGAA